MPRISGSLGGAYGTAVNGYALVDYSASGSQGGAGSLGTVLEPESPLMYGVASFSASTALRSNNAVTQNAVVVARWASGEPLVLRGTRGSRTLVELNFSPLYSAWTGDGAVLLRNALKYSRCISSTVAGVIGDE
jgi:hypothetical protein